LLPLVEILALEGVDGLLVATMVLSVPDEVSDQPAAQTDGLWSRRANLYWFKGRLFPDTRLSGGLVGVRSRVA
jgi:hypothetical protein